MSFTRQQRLTLLLIISAYAILAVMYALATPPLEASDEYKHYPFVQYVQTTGKLPILKPEQPGRWLQEGAQPPLYYLLMAGLTTAVDTGDLAEVHHKNPHAFIGIPGQTGNKNLIIHNPAQETFPWQGTILAVYLIRLASIGLGVGTLLLTAVIGQLLFSPTTALLAASLTAFNPMFLFVSAAVNNDSLSILLAHLALLLLIRLWQNPPDSRKTWWHYVLLGLVLGLGLLTKLSLGGLLILAGIILAWQTWQRKEWRSLFWGGLLIGGTAVFVSGWWFARNWFLYSDLTGLAPFIAVQGTRDIPLTWVGWLDEFGTFYRSFWGLFGGVNIAAPEPFYIIMNILALIGLAGLIKWLMTRANRRQFVQSGAWLLAAWTAILFLLLLRWNIISPAFQGRLMFPALGAINILLAVGLLAWVKPAWQSRATSVLAGMLLLTAVFLPWTIIRPAYAYPEPLTAVPASAQIPPITYTAPDGAIELIGVDMSAGQNVTLGGGPVTVTLYWRTAQPVTTDYISSVHLLGRNYESVGQIDRHPASGQIPTSRWHAGDIYRDEYWIFVADTAVAPAQLWLSPNLYNPATGKTLPASSREGVLLDPPLVGERIRLAALPEEKQPPHDQSNVPFAEGITLTGYETSHNAIIPGATIPLTLTWQANEIPSQDYTVFVQLLDSDRQWVAGADAPPINNFYPTSFWQPGDTIEDVHWLTIPARLPPGEYPVLIGLYEPDSGIRLPRLDSRTDFGEFFLKVEAP